MRIFGLSRGRSAPGRRSVRAWLTAALAALSSTGLAATALADGSPESITGSGTVAATQFSISVNAGPLGQSPSGSLHLTGFFTFDATPTCLNVAGHDGAAGFRIDTGPYAGQGFLTASKGDTDRGVSAVLYSGILPSPPTACPPPDAPPPNLLQPGGGGTVSGTLEHTGGPDYPLPLGVRSFPAPSADAGTGGIAQSTDGPLWFTEPGANRIASVSNDESGQTSEYTVPTPRRGPRRDRRRPLRYAAPTSDAATPACGSPSRRPTRSATSTGQVSSPPIRSRPPAPSPSAIGGDVRGGAWFTEPGANRIGYISESGRITEYPLPTPAAGPGAITVDAGDTGPAGDGAWFTETAAGRIGYIDASGNITEHRLPTPGAAADGDRRRRQTER